MRIQQGIKSSLEDEYAVHPRRSPRLLNNAAKCSSNVVNPKTPLISVEKASLKRAFKCAERSLQSCKESEAQATASSKSHTGLCLRRSTRLSSVKDSTSVCNSGLNTPVPNQPVYKLEKRLTRSSFKQKRDESTIIDSDGIDAKKKEKKKSPVECVVPLADSNAVRKTIGVKRKRNEAKGNEVWTDDQEQALQKAYFSMKPSPHFWKKVAKLVVGKSAQDCFDKVQTDHWTPLPRPKRRMLNNPSKPSSLSVSTSIFPKPKLKKNNAHKEVRKLLQQHCLENQDYETDLFSVLEGSTIAKSLKADYISEVIPQALHFDEHLPSSGQCPATDLASPPVLKQVKNKALHEKYIDKLHQREARRRAADKSSKRKSGFKRNEDTGNVKTAKDALVCGAQDVAMEMKKLEFNEEDDDNSIDEDD